MTRGGSRLVLLTGASAGIGRACASAFLARGDRVVALARSASRLDSLAEDHAAGDRLIPVAVDVTDAAAMEHAAAGLLDGHGPPDVIVANAGIGLDARFEHTRDEDLRAVFEVNVFGVVRTVRPFLPAMVERGSGRILLISSIVGKRGIPHYAAYSASKFALHGMAEALRVELWNSGVTIGLICPSSTETEFQDRLLREGPAQRRKRARRHTAESVARAVLRMADSNRRETILSPEARLLNIANRLAPGLVDRLLARTLNSRKRTMPREPAAGGTR